MATRELTIAEAEELTKDLQDVLEKHNAEMQTKTTIELVKRIDDADIPKPSAEEDTKTD